MRRVACLFCCVLWLAGCATTTTIPQDVGSGDVAALDDVFERAGRFAVSAQALQPVPDEEAMQAAQGGFVWQDDGQTVRMDFTSPLGATLARVRIAARQAWLQTSDNQELTAASAEDLVERILGTAMPVTPLRYWLRGRLDTHVEMAADTVADPAGACVAAEAVQCDEQGRLIRFHQHGWHVTLSRYDAQGPRLLRLERQTSEQLFKLRLVVDAG